MTGTELIENYMALFRGRTDAIGLGIGRVERREVTQEDYASHLRGEGSGIGIFPMLPDNTVCFAAIDLDEPNFELAEDFQKLLPGDSWVEVSRSGNAHVWVFFTEPCPAWAARAILKSACESLGRPDVEVFPKQARLRDADSLGNYINLPYHGNSRLILKGSRPDWMTFGKFTGNGLLGFVEAATKLRTPPSAYMKRAELLGFSPLPETEGTHGWRESPHLHECAKHILATKDTNPITQGSRAVVLFHLACQLVNCADFDLETCWALLKEANDAALPPLDERELKRTFDSAVNGRYTSTGCDDPLMAPYISPTCPIVNGR